MKGGHVRRVAAHDCITVGGLVAASAQRYVDLQRIACYRINTITYYRELVAADIASPLSHHRYHLPTAVSLAKSPRPRDPTYPPTELSKRGRCRYTPLQRSSS